MSTELVTMNESQTPDVNPDNMSTELGRIRESQTPDVNLNESDKSGEKSIPETRDLPYSSLHTKTPQCFVCKKTFP